MAILEEITALEDTINALRARQARLAMELAQVRAVESMPRRVLGRDEEMARLKRDRISVGAEIALARRVSPHAGARFLSMAKVLVAELPHTWAAFEAGHLAEHRAQLEHSSGVVQHVERAGDGHVASPALGRA